MFHMPHTRHACTLISTSVLKRLTCIACTYEVVTRFLRLLSYSAHSALLGFCLELRSKLLQFQAAGMTHATLTP